MQTFRSLGHLGTKLGPKNRKKGLKYAILHFRVLELLTDLQFDLRRFQWFQRLHRTNGFVYAQVVGATCKKKEIQVSKSEKKFTQ